MTPQEVKDRLDAYEQMVAKLKEYYGRRRQQELLIVNEMIFDLLAIAESKPPEPQLKVGDVIEAGQVPIGAKVDIKQQNGIWYRFKRGCDTKESVGFIRPESDVWQYITCSLKCTILEMPSTDKK